MILINENQIRAIFKIDTSGELYRRLLDIFESDMPKHIFELEKALKNEDILNVKKISHSIKSTSLNMGATDLANMADRLENTIDTTNQDAALIAEFHQCFQRTLIVLRGFLSLCKT